MLATTPTGFRLEIASPCSASWEGMEGSDRVRFCGQCRKNVFNLSALSLDQAHELLADTEGQVCVRFYQRPDGTVLTQDCPVGLAAIRRKAQAAIRRAAGASLALLGLSFAWLQNRSASVLDRSAPPTTYTRAPESPPRSLILEPAVQSSKPVPVVEASVPREALMLMMGGPAPIRLQPAKVPELKGKISVRR